MSPGRGDKPRSETSYLYSLSSETPSTRGTCHAIWGASCSLRRTLMALCQMPIPSRPLHFVRFGTPSARRHVMAPSPSRQRSGPHVSTLLAGTSRATWHNSACPAGPTFSDPAAPAYRQSRHSPRVRRQGHASYPSPVISSWTVGRRQPSSITRGPASCRVLAPSECPWPSSGGPRRPSMGCTRPLSMRLLLRTAARSQSSIPSTSSQRARQSRWTFRRKAYRCSSVRSILAVPSPWMQLTTHL